jgi:hypothetical protein
MKLLDADNYHSVSIGYANGAPAGEQHFRMTRQKND